MTWPNNVLRLAHAITVAEGSNPDWNNPGDLTGADAGPYPTLGTVNSDGVIRFKYQVDGEQALCVKCARMLAGQSHVYNWDWTLEQVGMEYSHGDPNWAINVAKVLGVPPTTTLRQLAQAA